jgi:hypothetical protein
MLKRVSKKVPTELARFVGESFYLFWTRYLQRISFTFEVFYKRFSLRKTLL